MIISYIISIVLFIVIFYLYKHLYICINNRTPNKARIKIGWALVLIFVQFVPYLNIFVNSFLLFVLFFSASMNDCEFKGKLFDFLNKEI